MDPTGQRDAIRTTGSPSVTRYHEGLLWISAGPPQSAAVTSTGKELRIPLAGDAIGNADPAVNWGPVFGQLAYATCAYLLNYPDAPGAAGRKLRPEVAAAMPAVSRDGRTYTFRIRPGFRFSPPSGLPVTAETFRYTIERALSPRRATAGEPSPAGGLLADLVGVTAFRAGKASHISGITVRDDTLTFRLTRAAGDFPARLSMSFFCPVPVGTATAAGGGTSTPIAMAGPYYVASAGGGRVVLERNPNYSGRRPRRTERIVYTDGITAVAAVSRVQRGRADYVSGYGVGYDPAGPLAPGGVLDRTYGLASRAGRAGNARYLPTPAPGSTRSCSTRDDRCSTTPACDGRPRTHSIARLSRPCSASNRPTASYPPPSAGEEARSSTRTGPTWTEARRLAGHGPRRKATLYFCGDPANVRIAQIVRANLGRIGIDVRIDQSLGCLTGPETHRLARADMELISLSTPSPTPRRSWSWRSVTATRCPDTGVTHACRRRSNAPARRAGDARTAAYPRLEVKLVRDAIPVTVYASFVDPEFFSARVGCRVSQGALNVVDLGALCVHA